MRRKLTAAAIVIGLVGALAPVAPAAAATVISYDLSAWDTSQTRSAGHLNITNDGLHIWTDDSTSNAKVAAYRPAPSGMSLNNVGTPALDWSGTSPAPGLQLVIDIAGGTGVDGILVGESVYGNNWWLSNSASQALKDLAPHTGGGNGSNWFGTLAEWASKTDTVGGGWIGAVGFSLGSGVKGDGVIKSMTFGGDKYKFKKPKWVKPKKPFVTKPTCLKPGKLVLPRVWGVHYEVTTVEGGKVVVTAQARTGFKLVPGDWEWTFVVPPKLPMDHEKCTPTTPTPTATVTPTVPATTPSATPPVTGEPTVPADDPSANPTINPTPRSLPVTGDDGFVPLALVVGAGMILLGGTLLYALRRKA